MTSLTTYVLQHFVNKSANSNTVPSHVLFKKHVKIGFIIAPFVVWFIWAS